MASSQDKTNVAIFGFIALGFVGIAFVGLGSVAAILFRLAFLGGL